MERADWRSGKPLGRAKNVPWITPGPMRARDGNVHRGKPKGRVISMISHLGASIP